MSAFVLSASSVAPASADYVLAPDAAILVTEHGTGFAFDMRNSFYAISAVGTMMLERTLQVGRAEAVGAVAAAYEAGAQWMTENGYEPAGDPWESYLDGPEVAEPRTAVFMPCQKLAAR